jgi:hypothetical protein
MHMDYSFLALLCDKRALDCTSHLALPTYMYVLASFVLFQMK